MNNKQKTHCIIKVKEGEKLFAGSDFLIAKNTYKIPVQQGDEYPNFDDFQKIILPTHQNITTSVKFV